MMPKSTDHRILPPKLSRPRQKLGQEAKQVPASLPQVGGGHWRNPLCMPLAESTRDRRMRENRTSGGTRGEAIVHARYADNEPQAGKPRNRCMPKPEHVLSLVYSTREFQVPGPKSGVGPFVATSLGRFVARLRGRYSVVRRCWSVAGPVALRVDEMLFGKALRHRGTKARRGDPSTRPRHAGAGGGTGTWRETMQNGL